MKRGGIAGRQNGLNIFDGFDPRKAERGAEAIGIGDAAILVKPAILPRKGVQEGFQPLFFQHQGLCAATALTIRLKPARSQVDIAGGQIYAAFHLKTLGGHILFRAALGQATRSIEALR